jgi:hypothetical protein
MDPGQVVHLMIPWILPIEAWLENRNTYILQKYGLIHTMISNFRDSI